MLVFFSSLIGLLTSLIPHIIKYLYLVKLQNYNLANVDSKFDLLKTLINTNQTNQIKKLLQCSNEVLPVPNSNFEKVNIIMRLLFAIIFCIIYVYIKYLLWTLLQKQSIENTYNKLWTNDDAVMFSMIISFYFGSKVVYSCF